MNILIVGNGSIGIESDRGFYINSHTGDFLKNVGIEHNVLFAQSGTVYEKNNNLQNFELNESGIKFEIIDSKKSLRNLSKLIHLIKKCDFIYLFYPGTLSSIIAIMAFFFNKPYGLYIRGQYYNRNIIDRNILKRSKFILTVSPSIAKDTTRFCQKSEVIKPMISINEQDIYNERKYTYNGTFNLLFVGRIEERKGINELLSVAKILKSRGLAYNLELVGGGDLYEQVSKDIERLDLNDRIILHGLVSDKEQLKRLYNKADAFVFTSHDEGFPRVLYEAMASGLPIFTTFVGGIPGRMEDRLNCREIPLKDPEGMAEIILDVLKRPEEMKCLGENGIKTLRQVIDGSLKTHEQLLLSLLSNEK